MNKHKDPFSRARRSRTHRKRRSRRARSLVWPLTILGCFAACLSDDTTDRAAFLAEESESTGAAAEPEGAPLVPAPPPAGQIIDTQPQSGWTEGSFSVSHDGAAEYDLPLWVPDGRRGMQPNLALHYNSGGGNGLLGVGWSLQGLSAITPCPRTLAEDGLIENVSFTGTDAYCLDGMRLRPTVRTHPEQEYRTERDTFARIVSVTSGGQADQPAYWRVWTRDGKLLTFGQLRTTLQAFTLTGIQPEAPLFQQSPVRVTAAWALGKIEDRNGNSINIEYETIETQSNMSSVEFVPTQIMYSPNRKVEFVYETRTDPVDGFQAGRTGGVHTRLGRRLKTIKMSAGGTLLREVGLAYHPNSTSITGRSFLSSVRECDNGTTVVCLNSLTFDRSPGSNGLFPMELTDVTDVGVFESSGRRFTVGDINGDGADDLLYGNFNNDWRMRFSNGVDGFNAPQNIDNIQRPFGTNYMPKIRPIDYDRDGRMDLLAEVPTLTSNSKFSLYRSTGTAYQEVSATFDTMWFDDQLGLYSAFFADVDGNGLPDYLAPAIENGTDPDGGDLRWRYRLNLGPGFNPGGFGELVTTNLLTAGPPPGPDGDDDPTYQVRATGLDGTKAQLLLWDKPAGKYNAVQLKGQMSVIGSVNLPFVAGQQNVDRRDLHFADINGDGLQDAIYPFSGLSAQLSSGAGFSQLIPRPPSTLYLAPAPPGDGYDLPVRILDFNGDGADDLLIIHPGHPTSSNDHKHGLQVYTWRNGGFVRIDFALQVIPPILGLGDRQPVQLLDFNGDGAMDIAHAWSNSDPPFPLWLRVWKRLGGQPDKLERVNVTGLGPRVEVDYTTLADRNVHTPCTGTYPLICPVRGGSIVARHRVANGATSGPAMNQFTHRYREARVDLLGRGWLGFAEHEVTDFTSTRSVTTRFDNTTKNPVDIGGGKHADVYPFAHLPKEIVHRAVDVPPPSIPSQIYEHKTLELPAFGPGTVQGTYVVMPSSVAVSDREDIGAGWVNLHSRTTTFTAYDAFGNAKNVKTVDDGSDRVDVLDYQNDENSWLIGKLDTRTTTDCTRPDNVCETRESSFDYFTNGNLKEVVVEPDDDEFLLRTTIGYGNFGNVTSIKTSDAAGQERTASVAYDSLDLYPTKATDALTHETSVNVDTGLGVPLDRHDENGVPTTMKWDRFGRLREVNHADGYFERYSTLNSPLTHLITVPNGAGGTFVSRSIFLDNLGREVNRTDRAFDGFSSVVLTGYDVMGRVARTSRPFKAAQVPPSPVYYTTYAYDHRDRLIRTDAPDGKAVRHQYNGLETHTVDANDVESFVKGRKDGRIDFRNEDDPKSAGWLQTRFEYGPFGLVKKVTTADGTIQSMEYDKLGRRIVHVDPSAGTTTSDYNAFGELIQEIDGAGRTTTFDHDVLGRPTLIQTPEGATTNTWDTAPNGKGKLQQARSPDGVVTRYEYDSVGHNKTAIWDIEGASYQVDIGFDDIGRLSSITYPDLPGPANRLRVNYTYNANGYLLKATDAATNVRYWRAEERNPAGQLLRESYGGTGDGNGVVVGTREYDPETGLLDLIKTDGPGGGLDSLTYDYDNNRNVATRWDTVGDPKRQTFTYDSLNRLVVWNVWKNLSEVDMATTFDYKTIGNLLSETVTGRTGRNVTYKYADASRPHALTKRDTTPYTYDGAGRQVTGPNRTVAYNGLGLPRLLTKTNGETTSFAYDANGTRALKRDAQQTTMSVAGLFERRVGQVVNNVHYIMADGRAVAQVTRTQTVPDGPAAPAQVLNLHPDGQGSIVQTTDPSGAIVDKLFYDPFGRRTDKNYDPLIPAARPSRLGYTGHEHDDELDLINMQGRIYDPPARRFLTPDPFIQAPLFSQSHNRYSYVWNNPATLTDPTGFEACDIVDADGCISDQQLPPGAGGTGGRLGFWLNSWHFNLGPSGHMGDYVGALIGDRVKKYGWSGAMAPASDGNNTTDPVAHGSGGGASSNVDPRTAFGRMMGPNWEQICENSLELDPVWLERFRHAASGEGLVEQGAPFGYPDEMLNLASTDPQLATQLAGPAAIHLALPVVLGGPVVAWTGTTQFVAIYGGGVGAMAAPGYRTFDAFKYWFGEAGPGQQWHHVVEQTTENIARFGPAAMHTANNLIRVATPIHQQISAFYSAVQPLISGSVLVRAWLSTQSYEFQYEFGIAIMRAFGAIK